MLPNIGSRRCLSVLGALALLVPLLAVVPSRPVAAAGVVTECTDAALRAAVAGGGAISFACSGTIALTSQLAITQDTVIDGAGVVTLDGRFQIRLIQVAAGAHLTLLGLTLTDGNAGDGHGGAVFNAGDVIINASTLSENEASHGGAIYNDSGASLVIAASTLSDNRARHGGGATYNQIEADLTMIASTVSGNVADVTGGAIGNAGSATVSLSTLIGSRTGNSSVITNRGSFRLTASILRGSRQACDGFIRSGGYNVSDSPGSCSFDREGDLDAVDLKLGPLADNGGPTLTHLPQPDSPALGRVPNDLCAELSAANNGADQRGTDRPIQDAPCDSGAVEVALATWCGWKSGRSPEPPDLTGWEC